jgi:DNA sulfur modification protein DndD
MKIEFMRLENWRSFHGLNELWFATDPEKNVTLIRAENGVGKTSLLAALNWCFFNILPSEAEFENPNQLTNEQSGASEAKIEVEFSHEGRTFKARRTYDQIREKVSDLKLIEIKDGVEIPLGPSVKPDRFINSVIPREMAPHFFFYGEATSKYAGETGSKQFGRAVKSILGSTVANMALEDIQKANRDYSRQAADNTSDVSIQHQNDIADCDYQLNKIDDEIEGAKNEEAAAQAVMDQLNSELAGTETIKVDQAKRAQLENQKRTAEMKLKSIEAESKKWLHKCGMPLLSKSFINDVKTLLSQSDTKKKIPGPYNEKFVNDILNDQICICGKPLIVGSQEHEHIKSLLNTASDEMMISRVISTTAAIGKLEGRSQRAWDELRSNKEKIKDTTEIISAADVELDEISERLQNSEISSIAEKERALGAAKTALRNALTKQGSKGNHKTTLISRRADLVRKQDALFRESEAARRYVKRKDLSQLLINRLKDRLSEEELYARIEIKRKIDDIIQKFMRKSLTVQIDQNYRLKVINDSGNEAAKSTGENQMLGLAFTGAIAAFAKERRSEESDILLSGTEAPLVVDSPFGHLDPLYRKGVASFLPELASQVVLLVSTSQASAEVLDSLDQRIGMQYVLSRYNEAPQGSKEAELIEINGTTFNLTRYDQEFTGTKIEEVSSP